MENVSDIIIPTKLAYTLSEEELYLLIMLKAEYVRHYNEAKDNEGWFGISKSWLNSILHWDRRKVNRTLSSLISDGWIEKKEKTNRTEMSRYRLTLEENLKKVNSTDWNELPIIEECLGANHPKCLGANHPKCLGANHPKCLGANHPIIINHQINQSINHSSTSINNLLVDEEKENLTVIEEDYNSPSKDMLTASLEDKEKTMDETSKTVETQSGDTSNSFYNNYSNPVKGTPQDNFQRYLERAVETLSYLNRNKEQLGKEYSQCQHMVEGVLRQSGLNPEYITLLISNAENAPVSPDFNWQENMKGLAALEQPSIAI